MSSRMQQLANEILAAGLAKPEDLVGCQPEDIDALMRKFRITLPEMYCEWLQILGRGAGHFLAGSDAFYPALLDLRNSAQTLLRENKSVLSLPPDGFVFLMHQGYQFLYFGTLPAIPDPPVFNYTEGRGLSQPWASVSSCFEHLLEDQIKVLKG